jgi:hypothetical protein
MTIDADKVAGGKRKNGHKMNCGCHICKNMEAKAQRHGYEEDLQKEQERKMGGPQKKNGHKKDCGCPICNNMKHVSKSIRKSVKAKGPKAKGLSKKSNGHKHDCGCPICKNMKKPKQVQGVQENKQVREQQEEMIDGGSRKKNTTRKSNGHKPSCGCPICKNMKKTRRNK